VNLSKKNAKKKIAALLSIAAVTFLAGCSSTSAAFTVGKSSTSVTDIQKSVDNILEARKGVDTSGMNLQTGSALVASQVQFLLISQLLVDTAKSVGLSVSQKEVAAAKDAAIKQVGGAAVFPKALVGASIDPKNVDLYFTSVVYSQKLAAYVQKNGTAAADTSAALTTLVSDIATKEGVSVNPRYGKWDPKTASLVPADAASGAVTSNK
jgi:hypothetical protein